MRLQELKMVVAENCDEYNPVNHDFISQMGVTLSETCDNCKNFIDGRCIKNLFDPIKEAINRN